MGCKAHTCDMKKGPFQASNMEVMRLGRWLLVEETEGEGGCLNDLNHQKGRQDPCGASAAWCLAGAAGGGGAGSQNGTCWPSLAPRPGSPVIDSVTWNNDVLHWIVLRQERHPQKVGQDQKTFGGGVHCEYMGVLIRL